MIKIMLGVTKTITGQVVNLVLQQILTDLVAPLNLNKLETTTKVTQIIGVI